MKSIKSIALLSLCTLVAATLNPCFANEFPGTGSKEAWQQACQISNQGNSLLQGGEHRQGFEMLYKALEIYPGDAELIYNVGTAHQTYAHMTTSEATKVAELEKAEQYFRQATAIKPSQAEILIRLANVQSELKKDSESIANLQAVLALPGLDPAVRQKTMEAMQYVEGKSSTTTATVSQPAAADAQLSAAAGAVNWQTYSAPNSIFTLKYPQGWSVTTDPKSGKIEAKNSSGATLAILPFYAPEKISDTSGFFSSFLAKMAPGQKWSSPQALGTAIRSTYVGEGEKAVAAMEIYPRASGVGGNICIARSPVGASAVPFEIFGQMISSLSFNTQAIAALAKNAGSSEAEKPPAGLQPANLSFANYAVFNDPSENSFSVEAPSGWTTRGGLTRISGIDVRPWVVAVAPDNSCTAFIGDGDIPPYTMPTSTLNWTGFTQGKWYNGTIVSNYIPARRFIEEYARKKLKGVLTDIQVVEEADQPDIARNYNGNATRSEAKSIKITGMYGNIPAVGYYLASTKASMTGGAGMWWVTLVAGQLCPAADDKVGLDVILHMLKTFAMKPEWQARSDANTARISANYRANAAVRDRQIQQNYANIQAANNRITSGYWAQQASNDRINSAYWNRQASQDHAANNFSNYIRGQETVRDTSTGTNHQVEYGPKYHWIDGGGNYTGTNYGSPGQGWNQLMSVP